MGGVRPVAACSVRPMLRRAIDQQAQDHDETEGYDALGLLHEHRGSQEQRILEEGEAAHLASKDRD